jgi:hypothetical protein
MKFNRNFTLIISWIVSIIIALLESYFIWFLLEIPFGYNFIERALVGMAFFGFMSLVCSYWRDIITITNTSSQMLVSAHDNIDITPDYRLREIIIFGYRFALAIYICIYWFNLGAIWMSKSASVQVSNMFLVLLVQGILLFINAIITVYMIVIEPWRFFVLRNSNYFNLKRKVFSLSGLRIFSITILFLLWYWFFLPILEVKFPSTLSFIALVLLIWGTISWIQKSGSNRYER